MKVKMLETTQGRDIYGRHEEGFVASVLEVGEVYEVSAMLGNWLVENRKAEEIKPLVIPHYGAQPEPAPRNDEKIYADLTENNPEFAPGEIAQEHPVMATKTRKGNKK